MPNRFRRPETGQEPSAAADKQSFHLLRYFVITSLLIILTTAILLQYSYRRSAVTTVIKLGETTNITLAQAALFSVRPRLLEFLETSEHEPPEATRNHPVPAKLDALIRHLRQETNIVRIKIYNRQGMVVFSTKKSQIGDLQADNPGVKTALAGSQLSNLIYRDSFNQFDRETNDDNLVQSYLPVWDSHHEVLGAFEIYTDVSDLVKQTEHTQLVMLPVLLGVFLLMFVLLVASVWRGAAMIRRQEDIIRERTHMLEFLSAQMLTAQEDEKKHIAHGLHESVAQTLSGVKMRLEALGLEVGSGAPAEAVQSLVGYLQEAINETSSMAMRLRPSSLDQFGLLETLAWNVKELRNAYPQIHIDYQLEAREEEIPRPLKIIIFRIIQDTLSNLAELTEADQARFELVTDGRNVKLEIEENSQPYIGPSAASGERLNKALVAMRERTLLSGGTFATRREKLTRIHTSLWEV